ncbi:MAG: peptidylprolyl isomerase [Actinomycetota bacterium]
MSKRSRDRQLAKLAARRHAERDAQRRRRDRILGTIAAVGAVILLVAAGMIIFKGGDATEATASPTVSPSGSPSAGPTPQGKPGTQTGTVDPQPAPAKVACGAEAPEGAGNPKPQFAGPPPMKIDPNTTYIARMVTSCGTIVIELDPKIAPQTVNSFVFLANHRYFDGQYLHRIDTSIDVLQGGDPTGTGSGGPGYAIPDELQGGETYAPGVFAMANAGADTGGSQFFIITGENGHNLDSNPNYTIFGNIIRGLDVAQRIQKLPIADPQAAAQGDISGQAPKEAVYIDSVTITEKP